MTTTHTVSGCPAALLLDGEAGIGKTAIGAACRCLLRGLVCRPLESAESAGFFAGLADRLDRIPEHAR